MPASDASVPSPESAAAAVAEAGKAGGVRSVLLQAGVVLAVAAAVRFWVLSDMRAANPALRTPLLDDRAYLEMARQFAAGEGRPWFLAPLYPWLLAQFTANREPTLAVACGLNAAVGALAAMVTALAARALHSPVAGWMAGAAYALSGAFVFHDVIPGQEPVLTLLHVATLLVAIRFARADQAGGRLAGPVAGGLAGRLAAAGIGVLTAVAMLGRGTSLALALMAVPGLLARRGRERVLASGALLLGLAAVLLPVAVANRAAAGALTPLPWSGGPNIYLANGPDARRTGTFMAAELDGGPDEIARKAVEIATRHAARSLTPAEVSTYWRERTAESLGESVGDGRGIAGHLLYKFGLFLDTADRGSNHVAEVEREFATFLLATPTGSWWWVVLGLPAAWVLARRRRAALAVPLVVGGTWLLLTVFFPLPRYRLPVSALCVVTVAAALVEVWRLPGAERRRALVLPGVLAAVLGGIALYPRPPADHTQMRVNLALLELGNPEAQGRALKLLSRALSDDPEHGPACEAMAGYHWRAGNPAEAIPFLSRAAQDARTRWSSQVMAVGALVDAGDGQQAWRVAQGLLGEGREDAQLFAFAAVAAHTAGRADVARGLLARARALDPDGAAVRWALQRL